MNTKKIAVLGVITLASQFIIAQNTVKEPPVDSVLIHLRSDDLKEVQVTNIITNDVIGKTGGSATGLLKRVSGVTFQSGSQASFRGLSSRYTTVTVDGLSAPITEQKVKAFSLGLLPPSAIQEMEIYKSGTYMNYGEWGGASVNIRTTPDVDKNFTNVVFNLGYQQNITFNDMIRNTDYGNNFSDYFGYGSDDRDLTSKVVGSDQIQGMERNDAAAQGAQLPNTWELENTNAAPNVDFGLSFGHILSEDGDKKISTINSLMYSHHTRGAHYNRARYDSYEREGDDEDGEVISSSTRNYMTDGAWETIGKLMLNSAWRYQLNDDHAINLDLSYTNEGVNQTLSRYFVGEASQKEGYYAQYGLTQKSMFLARLSGEHEFGRDTDVEWSIGTQSYRRRMPDLRRSASQRNLGTDEPFLLVIAESSKADVGARFTSDMEDASIAGRVDLDHDFVDDVFELKAGFLAEVYNRDFAARLLTNVKDDFTDPELRFVEMSELATVYAPENFGPEGYYLNDGTTDFDVYDASNELYAGYLGVDNAWMGEKIFTSVGVRMENFTQKLNTGEVAVDTTTTHYLPYIGVSFKPNKRLAIKAGFSQSLNRPAFRELSPFKFYDFDYRANIQGNENLQAAELTNLDFSIIYAIDKKEFFSLTPFYKHIENPIEMIYVIQADQPAFSFDNAAEANVGGVEFEFAKFLAKNAQSELSQFMLTGNFTYTSSSINLGENTSEISSTRPLQGQIPL